MMTTLPHLPDRAVERLYRSAAPPQTCPADVALSRQTPRRITRFVHRPRCDAARVAGVDAERRRDNARRQQVRSDARLSRASPPADANPDGYRRVRQAMAKKAILDARDTGLGFLRVAVTGYGPSDFDTRINNDLALWQTDPPRFWALLDRMFDQLDAAEVRLVPSCVWNIRQFPALGHDNIATFLRDPNSASRRLLARFLGDFISRYKERRTILFYEMGNELNLLADLDSRKQCKSEPCIWGDFTTADMTKFAAETAALIKSLDPSRAISSGYSLPRPAAAHLARLPEFSGAGADWTPDTASEFAANLLATQEPFDIIGIHVYPDDESRPSGPPSGPRFDPIAAAASAARKVGKKLFIGEFGDEGGKTRFIRHTLDDIVRERVDYAAIWVWEFYQTSTYETRNTEPTRFEIEPSDSADVIAMLTSTAEAVGGARPPKPPRPEVVLTWPLPCAQIDRPIALHAVASDGGRAATRVDFLIDGNIYNGATRAPYETLFNPSGLGSRQALLEARAVGTTGATTGFRITVRLNGYNGECKGTE
jgi:Big-like domain-containing protein